MANEAVIIELFNGGRPIRYACADGTTIPKGTIMELTDPRTVIANANTNGPIAGIAAAEKVANDGATTIAVYTDGIFDIATDAGTDNAGAMVANGGTANTVETAASADLLNGSIVGKLLETASDSERAAVRVNL